MRSTEQVMTQIINGVEKSLFLVSFVNVGVDTMNKAADRGVSIRMLLEESKEAARKLRSAIPRAEIYVWSKKSKLAAGNPAKA